MTSLLGRGGAITKCLRALPVLGTLAGPLEDRAMCTEVGTEATLKLREEVVTEYEMGFYGQGLTMCFCQLGLGSLRINSLQRTLWKKILAPAWEVGFAEWFIFTREEVTRCLQSPTDQAFGKCLCICLQGNVFLPPALKHDKSTLGAFHDTCPHFVHLLGDLGALQPQPG